VTKGGLPANVTKGGLLVNVDAIVDDDDAVLFNETVSVVVSCGVSFGACFDVPSNQWRGSFGKE
jgi:hypothetical protein